MENKKHPIIGITTAIIVCLCVSSAPAKTLITEYQDQSSSASLQAAKMNGQPGVAVVFEGTDDLHYYATEEGAPAPHLKLKVSAQADGVTFGDAVFPEYAYFDDAAKGKIEVYVGNFEVFIPIISVVKGTITTEVTATIKGIACTSELCLRPFTKTITAGVDLSKWPDINFLDAGEQVEPVDSDTSEATSPPSQVTQVDSVLGTFLAGYKESGTGDEQQTDSVWWFFLLAILAGLSINIMPCVLPVIPLIIMRLVGQAKESGLKRVALGFSFCGGIVLFFATFAVISSIIKISTGVVLDLNSIYRIPAAVITLFLFIVFFALVLLDIFTITLPGSVAGKQGGGSGFAGSIGMGFFAGILSTPCSGAIIGAVLVWAQTQPPAVSSTALVLMGVGMALPYAVLVSIPKLLDYVPKPGIWMEIFKKTGGFLLLIIAAKFMLAGLTKDHLLNVLLYGVIFAFCVWMWGTWVTFSTPKGRKWTVRLVALAIAVATGFWLLPAPEQSNWQNYDPTVVQNALEQNKPVLIKFTADWCTNCKVVEKNVYQEEDIKEFLKQQGFVTFKADTSQEDYQATVDYKLIFKEAGNLPNTILLNPKTKTMTKIRGIFTSDELKQAIIEQF